MKKALLIPIIALLVSSAALATDTTALAADAPTINIVEELQTPTIEIIA